MIKVEETSRNYHHGQHDLTAIATIDKKYVGHCDYSLYNNEISIQHIEVLPEYRRQGVASALMDFIHKEYDKVNYGYTTDDGTPFLKRWKEKRSVNENLNQALKILKDHKTTEKNPNFLKIKNLLAKHPGYLGAFTKMAYKFLDRDHIFGPVYEDLQTLYHTIINNPEAVQLLPKPVIEYDDAEDLGDDLSKALRKVTAKKVIRMFYKEMADKISLNDDNFVEHANAFLKLSSSKQSEFLKSLKYHHENDTNITKVLEDFYEFVDSGGSTPDEIRKEIYKLKNEGKPIKILIDTDPTIVIQSNDQSVIKKFGSKQWCIVYSDNYFHNYVDKGLQFLIFNFDVTQTNPDSLFGVTYDLKEISPMGGASQNRANKYVNISKIEEMCAITKDFFGNYVASLVNNLDNEIKKAIKEHSEIKLIKKYRNHILAIKNFVDEKIVEKLAEDINLTDSNSENFILKKAKLLNAEDDTTFHNTFIAKNKFIRVLSNFSLKLSEKEYHEYSDILKYFLKIELNLKYGDIFANDDVFKDFYVNSKHEKIDVAYLLRSFIKSGNMTLNKFNDLEYEDFKFMCTSGGSDKDSTVVKVLFNDNYDIKEYPRILKHMKQLFANDWERVQDHVVSIEFIFKNSKILDLDSTEISNLLSLSLETEMLGYKEKIEKIEKKYGTELTNRIKENTVLYYLDDLTSGLPTYSDTDMIQLISDMITLKVFDDEDKVKNILMQVFPCFVNKDSNKEDRDKYVAFALNTDFTADDLTDHLIYQDMVNSKVNQVVTTIGELAYKKNWLKLYEKEKSIRQMRIDLAIYFYLSSIAEVDKDKKEPEKNVQKITLAPKYILEFSEKYNLHFDSAQQGFRVKIDSLNDLQPLLVDDELELEDMNYHDYIDSDDDLETFIDDLDEKNQAKIRKICNIAKDQKITIDNITDEVKEQIKIAANDAYNDYVDSKTRNVTLAKLIDTKYFKLWNDNKYYKFDDSKYVLLATTKFLYNEWECDAFASDVFDSIVTIFNHDDIKINYYQNDFEVSYNSDVFNSLLEL